MVVKSMVSERIRLIWKVTLIYTLTVIQNEKFSIDIPSKPES